MTKRILIISSDILPYPGLPTVGSGLRAWGLGHGLKSQGYEVQFSLPQAALKDYRDIAPREVVELAWEHHSLTGIINEVAPDVTVVCNWPVMSVVQRDKLTMPVVLDQHGPHCLERKYLNFGTEQQNAQRKIAALRKADFFTCAGQKQWHYFQTWLEQAGWSAEERQRLTGVIPVSLSPDLPPRQPADELTFVYGGVFLPWQDPTNGLSALVEALDRYQRGKLYFFGGKHPVYSVNSGVFDELLTQLKRSPQVIAPGTVSHDTLIDRYRQAHVAVDVMARNPERELAFTTRTVEYLWCGLPVIYHDYAELSDFIAEYEAGWLVNPDDKAAITSTLQQIFEQPDLVAARSQNAQRLVRERLTWDKTITPLTNFIEAPQQRAHEVSPTPLWLRHAQYLVSEAWFHYRRSGLRGLYNEGAAYFKRQMGGR